MELADQYLFKFTNETVFPKPPTRFERHFPVTVTTGCVSVPLIVTVLIFRDLIEYIRSEGVIVCVLESFFIAFFLIDY
jgi:hypothetical protein